MWHLGECFRKVKEDGVDLLLLSPLARSSTILINCVSHVKGSGEPRARVSFLLLFFCVCFQSV